MSSSHTAAAVTDKAESAFTFIPYGAIIQEFRVGGHNIVQNFPESLYNDHNTPHFGETIGRTTNRVKDSKIVDLNGKTYTLNANNGPNSLHGGPTGWGKRDWAGPTPINRNGKEGIEFTYLSKDGEEGYPGTVECRCWYTAWTEEEKTVLEMEYEVELVGDECEETVVGVTNHSYFNLNLPSPTITGTIVTLGTTSYLEIDSTGIPSGRIIPYSNIPSKPSTQFTLGETAPDLDDCFVINESSSTVPLDTRSLPLRLLATLNHPDTGLHLEVTSTEPAFQFYTGKHIDVPELETSSGEKVPARGSRSGICIEPSRYVDCAGRKEWRSQCLIKKGELFGAKSVYKAWKD